MERRPSWLTLHVLYLAVLIPLTASAQRVTKLAVTEIKARRGVDPVLSRVIEEYLTFELAKIKGFQVIGRDDILRMLDHVQQKQMLGCNDESCLAEIGGALGVDKIVGGSMDKVGESILLTLKLIDIRHGTVERREMERLKGTSEEQALDGIMHLYRRMFSMELGQKAGDGSGGYRVWGWVSGGSAVASVVAGGVLLALGRRDIGDANSLADQSKTGDVLLSEVEDLEGRGRTRSLAGGVLLGVGGALGVLSLILFLLEPEDVSSEEVAAVPVLSGGVLGVVAGGRF
ncbi:MAG: hypothetical protein GXP49_04265 [Deltaproteobacteria bacterium]|nr:hypothetical protein [Deltaproteobacteria bacterium]